MVELEEFIRESNAIENVNAQSAVEETLAAWEFLEQKEKLTHSRVKIVHWHIMENRQPDIAGDYRRTQVYVGDNTPPPPAIVGYKMESLLTWSPENTLEALKWHIAFERIHPFADGNGRTGRLLYFWHCRKLGSEPLLFRAADREGYYDLFDSEVDIDRNTDSTHDQ